MRSRATEDGPVVPQAVKAVFVHETVVKLYSSTSCLISPCVRHKIPMSHAQYMASLLQSMHSELLVLRSCKTSAGRQIPLRNEVFFVEDLKGALCTD